MPLGAREVGKFSALLTRVDPERVAAMIAGEHRLTHLPHLSSKTKIGPFAAIEALLLQQRAERVHGRLVEDRFALAALEVGRRAVTRPRSSAT